MSSNREVKAKQFVDENGIIDGSGTSGLIRSNNSKFEANIGDWLEYSNSVAGPLPEDGDGGTAGDITLERTAIPAEILEGNGSLKLTKANLASAQGQGASLTLDVDKAFRAKPMKLSFDFDITGTFVPADPADPVGTPGDLGVYYYDVTNSQLITPNQPYITSDTGRYESLVQLPDTCEQVRVILHVQSTSTDLWVLFADNFKLDIASNQNVNNDSNRVSYTPTTQGFGTISNVDAGYAIDGDHMIIDGYLTIGTRTASEAQLSLPSGYVIANDTSSPIQIAGEIGWSGGTSAGPYFLLATAGDTFLNFSFQNSAGLTPKLGNAIFGNATSISFKARVKVEGLTASALHPASIGLNAQAVMRAYKNGGAMAANTDIGTWTTVEKDSLNAFNATTGVYTVNSPGDYQVQASSALTAVSGTFMRIKKNGTSVQVGGSDNSDSLSSVHTILTDLVYGDTISVEMSSAVTAAGQNDGTSFSINKIGSQNQPYAPRTAFIKDIKANSTSGGTFTAGSWQTRDLNTITGDSSFVSLSANQFTLQPGKYIIEATAPGYNVNRHKVKLRNITDASDSIMGSSEFSLNSANASQTISKLKDEITIDSAKVFEIQHVAGATATTNGFGVESGASVDEVYTQVKITKVL